MLRISSLWRIRQINLPSTTLMNASIHRVLLSDLPVSERLHLILYISQCQHTEYVCLDTSGEHVEINVQYGR